MNARNENLRHCGSGEWVSVSVFVANASSSRDETEGVETKLWPVYFFNEQLLNMGHVPTYAGCINGIIKKTDYVSAGIKKGES